MTTKLTATQRHVLNILARPTDVLQFTSRDVLRYTAPLGLHATQQGAVQTLASLVRRGLATKGRDIDGHVCYGITYNGLVALGRLP